MLKKGEMAVSIRKKNDSVRRNVAARFLALKATLSDAHRATQKFVLACETQTKFAALEMPDLDIYPLSLNAMKAAADAELGGDGWAKVDGLRKQVVLKFSTHSASHRPVRGLSERRRDAIVDLNKQLEHAYSVRSVLGQAYLDLLNELRRAARSDEMIATKLARHLQTYEKISGLRLIEAKEK